MSTVLQQLLAEYEASTQGEWEVYFESLPQDDKIWYVFVRDGDRPADECTSVFDCSYVAWEGGGHPPEPADTRFILSAHNKMPLLLAVAEAAAELQLAEAELNSGSSDIADWTPFEHVRAHKRYRRARAALEEVITPLLENLDVH